MVSRSIEQVDSGFDLFSSGFPMRISFDRKFLLHGFEIDIGAHCIRGKSIGSLWVTQMQNIPIKSASG